MSVTAAQQELRPGAEVVLFELDLVGLGEDTQFYFCKDPNVSFNGQAYAQMPVQMGEVERSVTGDNPAPRLAIPNTTKFASSLVTQYNDLVGAFVIRTKTLQRFLDGEESEDGDAFLSRDIFIVEQKTNLNKQFGEWELRPIGDTADRTFPGRTAMKKVCPYVYRTWDPVSGQFIPSRIRPCPYTNTTHKFDEDNNPVSDPALDKCNNLVSGCLARKPGWPNGYLKFGGFPGMNRYRVS